MHAGKFSAAILRHIDQENSPKQIFNFGTLQIFTYLSMKESASLYCAPLLPKKTMYIRQTSNPS